MELKCATMAGIREYGVKYPLLQRRPWIGYPDCRNEVDGNQRKGTYGYFITPNRQINFSDIALQEQRNCTTIGTYLASKIQCRLSCPPNVRSFEWHMYVRYDPPDPHYDRNLKVPAPYHTPWLRSPINLAPRAPHCVLVPYTMNILSSILALSHSESPTTTKKGRTLLASPHHPYVCP